MMPTPNVHLESQRDVYADLAEPLQRTEVPLFYVTDRAPERDEAGNLYYGSGRSASLAFGTAVVDLENKGQTTIASDRKPWSVPIYALVFRFYGPEEGYINKSWVLSDLELLE